MLKGKSILLGITGSVAAYKSIDIIKRLRQEGASVRVIMTEASTRFVTPLSIELAVGEPVYTDMFKLPLSHVSLPAGADLFLVAPATANCIGKYAQGIADDMLSTTLLAFSGQPGRVLMAPAMNWRMYENPIFKKNLDYLASLGVQFIGPERGSLACGEEGIGRMADIEKLLESVIAALTEQDLAGENVLVTAGPTREYIDPVRYITNRSSGKMGYALAQTAGRRGAEVTLVSGPVSIRPPEGVDVILAESSRDMYTAVMDNIPMSSLFIMSAAVADFMAAEPKTSKIEKKDKFSLNLLKTTDILEAVGRLKKRPFTVGFSAETGPRIDRARKKLAAKNIDMIVFNDVSKEGSGFDVDTNEVVIIDREGERKLPVMKKVEVAAAIFDRILELKGG
ncbi:MAG: bifunctional phosphopantothenoylcysteine decarboxylase/phosphopantothenate--cysteine ligase CoaBC [Nitrospirae bacterium]|nr:bifunctional phosphopantothenoylcysteine decarboxylase/phosphopantothenate--cysteine ligase CoaBC [Nitrospirota bacterium]